MGGNMIWGISGILATIIFGTLSLYLIITRRYPGQITFIKEDSIALFDAIVKNFSDLSVLYKDTSVGEGLVLLKGALLNTGTKDITEEMVGEPITLTLPEGYVWHSAKVSGKSQQVHGRLTREPTHLIIDLGLFRCGEFVRLEAVSEVPVEEMKDKSRIGRNLTDVLEITHRIADTQKVRRRDIPDDEYATRRIKNIRIPLIGVVLMMLGLVGSVIVQGPPATIHYLVPIGTNTIEVAATPRVDGTLVLRGITDKSYKEVVNASDFLKTMNQGILIKLDRKKIWMLGGAVGVNTLFLLAILGLIYRDIYRAKRYRRLLDTG